MGISAKPLLIKRYASRRLYDTECSDYVTLDDIAAIIRSGREVEIIDRRSGQNVTPHYLLQIIADHEARGEHLLPATLLSDLVRAYGGHNGQGGESAVSRRFALGVALAVEGMRLEGECGQDEEPPSAPQDCTPRARPYAALPQAAVVPRVKTGAGASNVVMIGRGRSVCEPDESAAPAASARNSELQKIRAELAILQRRLAEL